MRLGKLQKIILMELLESPQMFFKDNSIGCFDHRVDDNGVVTLMNLGSYKEYGFRAYKNSIVRLDMRGLVKCLAHNAFGWPLYELTPEGRRIAVAVKVERELSG